jgi:hypothetical protein
MVTIIRNGESKDKIKTLLEQRVKQKKRKKIDLKKYCGILNLKEDPLAMQKRWRDEWK